MRSTFKEKIISLKRIWHVMLLFVLVLGGIYGGIFSKGEPICTKMCPGGESVWDQRFVGPGTSRPREYMLNWDVFKYLFFKKDNPDYEFLRDFNFDTIAIAVQDHGVAPKGVSDRAFRFEIWRRCSEEITGPRPSISQRKRSQPIFFG
jgi:hypothetical protein